MISSGRAACPALKRCFIESISASASSMRASLSHGRSVESPHANLIEAVVSSRRTARDGAQASAAAKAAFIASSARRRIAIRRLSRSRSMPKV